MTLRILIAQLDLLVGDIAGNGNKVITLARRARDEHGADLVVFPELTLTGYPPEDLLLRPEFIARTEAALREIVAAVDEVALVIGYPKAAIGGLFNVAGFIHRGQGRRRVRQATSAQLQRVRREALFPGRVTTPASSTSRGCGSA